MRRLIEGGVALNGKDVKGMTAIMYFADHNFVAYDEYVEIIRLFLKNGALLLAAFAAVGRQYVNR